MGASCSVKRNMACVHVCVCVAWGVCSLGDRRGWGLEGMAGIVMREEKVRQCKVFVVLMQGEDSCWEGSDAAVAPARRLGGRGAEVGLTFYRPPPPLFLPKRADRRVLSTSNTST